MRSAHFCSWFRELSHRLPFRLQPLHLGRLPLDQVLELWHRIAQRKATVHPVFRWNTNQVWNSPVPCPRRTRQESMGPHFFAKLFSQMTGALDASATLSIFHSWSGSPWVTKMCVIPLHSDFGIRLLKLNKYRFCPGSTAILTLPFSIINALLKIMFNFYLHDISTPQLFMC